MEGYEVDIVRAAIKARAKEQLRDANPSPMLVTLIFCAIIFLLRILSTMLTSDENISTRLIATGFGDMLPRIIYHYEVNAFSFRTAGLVLSINMIIDIFSAGYSLYSLKVSRQKPSGIGDLFGVVAIFPKALGLLIVQMVLVMLWSLLFIIPGIIAGLRYSMALYIMLDNPDMSIMECIKASSQLMDGRKRELFVLQLSFMGWGLLEIIPFVTLWVTPYRSVTTANFYNAILNYHNRAVRGSGGGIGGEDTGPYQPESQDWYQDKNEWQMPAPPSGDSNPDWKDGKPPWER